MLSQERKKFRERAVDLYVYHMGGRMVGSIKDSFTYTIFPLLFTRAIARVGPWRFLKTHWQTRPRMQFPITWNRSSCRLGLLKAE